MKSIRAILIDDEPLARDGLRLLLDKEPDLEIVGAFGSGEEAMAAMLDLQADVLFLDIQMPEMNGFEIIEAIGTENMPQVIFVTAYDEYAVEAFQFHAMDYLLKPVHRERLQDSLQRLRSSLQQNDQNQHGERLNSLLDMIAHWQAGSAAASQRLVVKSHGHVVFLNTGDVTWVEASGDYVTVHTEQKSHLLRETMHNLERKLQPHGFQRIHRSSIVNLAFVQELKSSLSNEYQVILKDGTALNLGRSFKDALYAKLLTTDLSSE